MRTVRRVGILALLVAWGLVATGCGIKSVDGGAPFPARAIDAAGTAVTIPTEPGRIVSADPGATAILRDLGLGDQVVPTDATGVLRAASDPTTGLVIVPLTADPELLRDIDDATAAVIYRYGAADLEGAPSAIVQLGLAVGRGPDATRIADGVASGLQAVANRVASQTPVRTLIEGAGFTALGPDSALGRAVSAAGGTNVVPADTMLDPNAIRALGVVAWISAQPGGSTFATLSGIEELQAVPAIRDGRVVPLPLEGFPIDAALPGALQSLADDLQAAGLATQ
jgi:ABC-type Fe3+-hydroxamate transport system substrate-binding protein